MIKLGGVILVLTATSVVAADPEVCRPYARLLTDNVIREVWTRAYTHCLNLEEDNPIPPETWQGLQQVLNAEPPKPIASPIHHANEPPPGEVPASGPPSPSQGDLPAGAGNPSAHGDLPAVQSTGRSGFVRGTAEWQAYCKKYWPASWDPKTQTVIKTRHKRIPCPA
jgi:hypothetical protein